MKMDKKPRINLLSWLTAGDFSGVRFGETRERVHDLLGVPVGWLNTEQAGEVKFMDANVWGYGIWTLYFDDDALDAVTCAVSSAEEHGWHFDVEQIDQDFFCSMDDAERVLGKHGIPCVRITDHYYKLQNSDTKEIVERRRRLIQPTILAGEELRTRIIFDENNGKMKVIGNPFNIRRQVLSYKKLDPRHSYFLLNA